MGKGIIPALVANPCFDFIILPSIILLFSAPDGAAEWSRAE
jgi:hypothetical protein